jgi:hypothetical protein
MIEALDIISEVAERGKKGGGETLMARQELPVLESELEMIEEALQGNQSVGARGAVRSAPASDRSPRRASTDRWQEL